jgi:tRNA-2-methylthio-N6-dimethylallyladenosine synthase
MNLADTEVVRSVLAGAGYREAPAASEADVVLVNTCAIREKAEDKIWCRLGTFRALREQRRAKDRCAHVLRQRHLLWVCCRPVYQ